LQEAVINLYARMAELAQAGRRFALATVVRTHGSTPQVVGAKLVVTDGTEDTENTEGPERRRRRQAMGTLGGGCVEADAILAAREVLANGGRSLRAYELTEDLAWNTGLVCGGTMWILAERDEEALAGGAELMTETLASAADGGPPVAVATLLRKQGRQVTFGGRVFVDAAGGRHGTLGSAALDEQAVAHGLRQIAHGTARLVALDDQHDLLVDSIAGRPKLVIAGGGHVALAIAKQAQLLDFDVTVIEDRPQFADPVRFAGARVLQGDVPETLAATDYGWSSFIVIATRGHKLDADCVLAAVKTKARYIGLLGSRRKTILIEEMLKEHGVADDRVRAIHAPVGLDLGGRTPAEIALSVLAEITQIRYQGTGQPLTNSK
jgi:xanthine dehydrogenase accessory factor